MKMDALSINLLYSFLSIAIPVFVTIYTVNKRIKVQARENHQPHLILDELEALDSIDECRYNLTVLGNNYRELHPDKSIETIIETDKKNVIYSNMILKNIGYGVATNIKFYNLMTTEQLHGSQHNDPKKNQKLFTTLDIAAGTTKYLPLRIMWSIKENDGITAGDHNRLLCVYKDLNNYISSFIIAINVKADGYYDFFAYQPSSVSYRKWIKEGKREYHKILKKYDD